MMNTKKKTCFALGMAALVLAGCGSRPSDRALSGGAIGAGVGMAGTALVGGHMLAGAMVGGAVGAIAGAVTDKSEINLGR